MIIKDAVNKQPWWQGMEGTCPDCGTVVELEGSDTPALTDTHSLKVGHIIHHCPTCHGYIEFTKSPAKSTKASKGKKAKKK